MAAIIAVMLFLIGPAAAELPSPRFDRLKPLGVAAGTSIEVEIAGSDLEDVRELLFDHPGLTATPIEGKDRQFQLHVAPDVPAGTYDVRLVGRFGVSNPRLFAVTHGLTDVAETEPNNELAQAQLVPINSAVNGTSDQNSEDLFCFALTAGQRIVIDCQAGKLDSPLDAVMTLMSTDGRQLAANSDYNGRDPLLDFIAPTTAEFVVSVHDLSYRGGHPYRLLVTDHPYVENVSPRAVQVGTTVELTALGRNLGSASAPSEFQIDDLPLDAFRFTLTAPTDVAPWGAYRFVEHPTDYSVLPTAATCTLTGFQVRSPLDDVLGVQPLVLSDGPVTLEAEPNDDRDKPQIVSLPLVMSGRFDRPRDADWYEFETSENGSYAVDVYCERINGHADPYVVVLDDQGNRVQELDDFGIRMNAFDGHLRDPAGTVNLSGKRKYRILVQDRYQRGGARYQYVLTVRQAVPDFYAAVIHSQNPGPGGTTVWCGGAAYLDVIIHQREGFNGPITITAENLPPGLHVAPTTITNDSRGVLVLWADDSADEWTGTIKLIATARRGEEDIRREVRPYTRVWNDAGMGSSRPTRELAVAIRQPAPFALQFTTDKIEVVAGQKAELTLQLKRIWPDFKYEVNVLPLSFPGNFKMSNGKLSSGQTEVTVTIDVQANARPGDYTIAVLGQAQVPFNKDATATDRPNTLVSLPSQPITIRVTEPQK